MLLPPRFITPAAATAARASAVAVVDVLPGATGKFEVVGGGVQFARADPDATALAAPAPADFPPLGEAATAAGGSTAASGAAGIAWGSGDGFGAHAIGGGARAAPRAFSMPLGRGDMQSLHAWWVSGLI